MKTFAADMDSARAQRQTAASPAPSWHEIYGPDGKPRPLLQKVMRDLTDLAPADMKVLDDRMEATLREMGVTFDIIRTDPWGQQPWTCDLLPQVFESADWELIVRGIKQRLHAFECFLRDVYHRREILRAGVVPIHAVLGSPHYQNAAVGLPRPRDSFLHLSGICLSRDVRGGWQVKHHHFSHATGISYMMQNRRALARVIPELFQDLAVQSLADVPLTVLERLRETAETFGGDPTVVLLSPGAGPTVSTEQSFLARRMGIPMVQGGDLLVLNDRVYLKTVRGLERVEVIYNRVADVWLDPLVFRRDSFLGVPGLVHCLRKGTVALVNAVGAQLADDRSLLAYAPQIIRFYLGEAPILPAVPTLWLGDIDQREMVLENLGKYRIRPIFRENTSGSWERPLPGDEASLRLEIRRQPASYVAQPHHEGAPTLCLEKGKKVEYPQDHVIFAMRSGTDFEVFPGALTRVHSHSATSGDFGFGWTSKDSWVLSDATSEEEPRPAPSRRHTENSMPSHQVTSRVAESFFWMGRYLERAYHQAYLISIIETLETEELNSAERKHYRPMWNRLLPPIEKSAGTSRRSIANRIDRYRLVLLPEPGSVVSTFLRAVSNAEGVQDSLSPEAWATISNLRTRFQKTRFREGMSEIEAVRTTRRMVDFATQLIPQFFAVSANTMLADDGWRFCEMGQMLERAVITANSVVSISKSLDWTQTGESHGSEIELSAFLRLLGCRDAYRRIYQMRAEPTPTLALLWQNQQVPRSVLRCLTRCGELLRSSIAPEMLGTSGAAIAIDSLIMRIQRIDWRTFIHPPVEEDHPVPLNAATKRAADRDDLGPLLDDLLGDTLGIHDAIADSFLNHQAHITAVSQPMLAGF